MGIGIKILSAIGNVGLKKSSKRSWKTSKKGKSVKKAKGDDYVSKHLGFIGNPSQSDFDNPTEGLYSAALEVKANDTEVIEKLAACKTKAERREFLKEHKAELFMSFSVKKFSPAVVLRNATEAGMDHLHFVRQWVSCQSKAEFRALKAVIEDIADTVLESDLPEDHGEIAPQQKADEKVAAHKVKRVKA